MYKVDIADVGLTTSDIILAAHSNCLYSGFKNISKYVLDVVDEASSYTYYEDELFLNDLSGANLEI